MGGARGQGGRKQLSFTGLLFDKSLKTPRQFRGENIAGKSYEKLLHKGCHNVCNKKLYFS